MRTRAMVLRTTAVLSRIRRRERTIRRRPILPKRNGSAIRLHRQIQIRRCRSLNPRRREMLRRDYQQQTIRRDRTKIGVPGTTRKGSTTWQSAIISQAINADPRDGAAYYGRALAYQAQGKNDKAQADFAKAKRLGYTLAQADSDTAMPIPESTPTRDAPTGLSATNDTARSYENWGSWDYSKG